MPPWCGRQPAAIRRSYPSWRPGSLGLTLIVAVVVFVTGVLVARYKARAGGPAWKARYSNPESRRSAGIRR